MQRHPFLLGTAILFWGLQTGYLTYAVVMAAAVETSFLVKARMAFTGRDFERVSDLSAVLLAGLTLYQFDNHGFRAIFPTLEASPFAFFPLVLAQRFSTSDQVSYAALFLSIRRGVKKGRIDQVDRVDVEYPFFVVCLLAASAGGAGSRFFFGGLVLLVAWVLWCHRPPGRRIFPWLLALTLPFLLGFAGQKGVVEARRSIEPLLVQLFQERFWARRDPYRAQTAIGHIGRLKVSQQIVARVRPGSLGGVPARLREAVYQTYSRQLWLARNVDFEEIDALGGGTVFEFGEPPVALGKSEPSIREAHISAGLVRGRGMLMVPNGTFRVQGLNVDQVSRNMLGSTKVKDGPELIEYTARFEAAGRYVKGPDDSDLAIPSIDAALFDTLARELGLVGLPAGDVVNKVRHFFNTGFTYSLLRKHSLGVEIQPLQDFLTVSRSGHCEYYATATVLLLRAGGVPARYVTGYAVYEWSPLEDAFVVRRRHAHSWASAFVDGRWLDVDTTPAVWAAAEYEQTPWWLGPYDLLSWGRFQFNRWRYDESEWMEARTMIALAIFLSVILAWRLARTTRVVDPHAPMIRRRSWPGLDSELYEIELYLSEVFGPRLPGETWRRWIARLRANGEAIHGERALLDDIVPRHYRYRFDPLGLSTEERARLAAAARQWLESAPVPDRSPRSR